MREGLSVKASSQPLSNRILDYLREALIARDTSHISSIVKKHWKL
jgi:hypothetical protein